MKGTIGRTRALDYLAKTGADLLLLTEPNSLRYVSGFSGGEGMVLIGKEGKCVLCTDSRYTTQASHESPGFEIREMNAAHPYPALLAEFCREMDAGSICYEDGYMTCRSFAAYRKALPEVEFVGAGNDLVKLREIKTKEEIELLAVAEQIGCDAFAHVVSVLRPGMTELAAAAEIEGFMKRAGAEQTSFTTIVASGVRSAMPHGEASEKMIESGDFVTMDFGCVYHGYCSDMTRTVVAGKASGKQREIYETVLLAQKTGLTAVRPGVVCSEADAASREVIEGAGYGEFFGHGLGHGVGLHIHEEPRLSPRDQTVLAEGMIVTVEPGIYIPGFGGVRIEDMVAVTADGIRNLTASPKELIELPF